MKPNQRWQRVVKRGGDIAVAAVLLLLLAPFAALAAALIWAFLGRPVLFRQRRPGRHENPFTILKFRTMCDACGSDGQPLPDEMRLSTLGKTLRRLSIDEIPQLWNVLRGEMSLVGPRPLLIEYLALYTPEQRRRHAVTPGITGWAQVNGRNALKWEERFSLDVWYVDNWSLWLDLRILALTVVNIWRKDGISEPGMATMSRFTGSRRAA